MKDKHERRTFTMTDDQLAVLNDMKKEHPNIIDYIFTLLGDIPTNTIYFDISTLEQEYVEVLISSSHKEYESKKYTDLRTNVYDFIQIIDDLACTIAKCVEFAGDSRWELWIEKDVKDFREVF